MKQDSAAPTQIVVFGVTGDLAKRKVLPSLFHLFVHGHLGDDVEIIGPTRREIDIEKLKQDLLNSPQMAHEEKHVDQIENFMQRINFISMDISKEEDYKKLNEVLNLQDATCDTMHNRLFYLAIPPSLFKNVSEYIATSGITKCTDGVDRSRLMLEKPFGHNLASAEDLVAHLNKYYSEDRIYRIDHYLAKEATRNMLYFRFKNPIIKRVWNPANIREIQISAIESLDVQGRGSFYEGTGALRDMLQSHLMQLLALSTMKEPKDDSAEAVRSERIELFKSIKPIKAEDVATHTARGQYEGYKEEVENPDSLTETFSAVKIALGDRWVDTPVFLRAGKALDKKHTEITIIYNDEEIENCRDNIIRIRIHPDEGIEMELSIKTPGFKDASQQINMDFTYAQENIAIEYEAYEKLFVDALHGDQTLFPAGDAILFSWRLFDPILEQWEKDDSGLGTYKKGSTGPDSANKMMEHFGTSWRH